MTDNNLNPIEVGDSVKFRWKQSLPIGKVVKIADGQLILKRK